MSPLAEKLERFPGETSTHNQLFQASVSPRPVASILFSWISWPNPGGFDLHVARWSMPVLLSNLNYWEGNHHGIIFKLANWVERSNGTKQTKLHKVCSRCVCRLLPRTCMSFSHKTCEAPSRRRPITPERHSF